MITVPQNKSDLLNLIENKIEENISLEYKAADALLITDFKKKEIAKDVSAMANASGGIIIYGIKEFDEPDKKHLPEKITPIDRIQISKEWLEQVIDSNISPKIQGLLIHPVQIETTNEVVYIVEIPQGTTAHQNTADLRYYRRRNFKAEPMQDYEIRDIMNRKKNPIITIGFTIEKNMEKVELKIALINSGIVFAKYINFYVYLPEDIVNISIEKKGNKVKEGILQFSGYNLINHIWSPVLPGMSFKSNSIKLNNETALDDREISWYLCCDNVEPKKGKLKLNEIPLIEEMSITKLLL